MMRSLFAGVTGLRNHQTRMDVIGNNIANVNTTGFKASRVTFQDVLSQTLQGASSGLGERGGTNPMQVGLGMGLASIDTIFTDGSFQPTGKQTDLSIQGSGFFILSDGQNKVYTRAGAFDFDNKGNLLVPGTGYKVMGWVQDKTTGLVDTTKPIESIQIPVGSTMAAKVSDEMTFTKNLSPESPLNTKVPVTVPLYDGKGTLHKLSGTLEKTAANQWTFTPGTADTGATATGTTIITFDSATGKFVSTTPASSTDVTLDIDGSGTGTDTIVVKTDFSALTQSSGETTVQGDANGYPTGTLEGPSIDTEGVITGKFSNGQSQVLGRICLATFNNPSGLNKVGDNLYAQSNNSGKAEEGTPNSGGRGKLSPGSLEMSNVDLAQEFSNMIITQRGFQANSKIISVSDEMLQDLANLKR